MSDIFQEVDEALKQEKLERWWKDNGKMVLWFCFCLIFFTGLVTFGKQWMEKNRAEETASLVQILDRQEIDAEALKGFADDASSGLEKIALFTAAAEAFNAGDQDKALTLLSGYASNHEGELYGDYARYLYVAKSFEAGAAEPENLYQDLDVIIDNESSPWRAAALELKGLIAYEAGNFELALSNFQMLMDEENRTAPSRMERADKMRHLAELRLKASDEQAIQFK